MPRPRGLMLLAVVIGMSGLGPPAAAEPAVGSTGEARRAPETRSEVQLSFAPLVKAAAPAVVNIYTRRVVESRASPLFDDPFFRRFFGDMMMPEGTSRGIQNRQEEHRVGREGVRTCRLRGWRQRTKK